MAILLSIISILAILFYKRLTAKTLLTPSGTLAATWLVFLLFKSILSPLIFYSYTTHLYVILMIMMFTAGEHIHILLLRRKYQISPSHTEHIIDKFVKNLRFELRLRISIIMLGLMSLLGSLLYAQIIAGYFGSFNGMLSAGWAVRGAIAEGFIQVPLIVRGLSMLGYSGIILAIVYWVKYQYRFFLVIPFVSMLIFGIAQSGRAGMILVIIQVFLGSYWKDVLGDKKNIEAKLIRRVALPLILILGLFVAGSMMREQNFSLDFSAITMNLSTFKVYAFGGIGSLTSYLDKPNIDILGLGRFSFASLYDLLGIHRNIMGIYTDYLPISDIPGQTSNIYTVIRPTLDDFGLLGYIIYFFIIGYVISIGYEKAKKKDIKAIAFTIVNYSFIIHTPLLPMTVHNAFLVSMLFPQLVIFFIENLSSKKGNYYIV